MSELPSGTVSFLFTDVEGSTRLLQHLGNRYGDVLADHHRLLRTAFADEHGQVTGTEGDAFFVVFRRAREAVAAAADAQRSLAGHDWPAGAEVRVRMGIHTGEPSLGDEGYHGMSLHRAARIAAAGHGGQVLLSNTTRELVEDDLPGGVKLRDLGDQRLKDLDRPERVFQLEIDGLRNDFPPLKTLDTENGRPAHRVRRRVLFAAAAAAVATAVAVPVLLLGGGGAASVAVAPNSLAVIDPAANRVVDSVPVGARPVALTYGLKALWVGNLEDSSISKVDPVSLRADKAIAMEDSAAALAAGEGNVWAIGTRPGASSATLRRIDPAFDTVDRSVRLPGSSGGVESGAVAVGEGSVWAVTGGPNRLVRVEPRTGRVVDRIDAGAVPAGVATGGGAVWVTDLYGNTVERVDPRTGLVEASVPVGQGPTAIAYGDGAAWVANTLDDSVMRIDRTNAVGATVRVGHLPAGIAVGAGGVWVANAGDGTVSRIDPHQNKVVETIETGGSPGGVAVAHGRVWVAVEAREQLATARGILRVEALGDPGTLDPALAVDPKAIQIEQSTCAKLVDFRAGGGSPALRPEADAAVSLPTISADGRTYAFEIRSGLRFSPPSNEPVTASTFKYSIERSLAPKLRGPARGRLSEVKGVGAYESGRAIHIAGIRAEGRRLTIKLDGPAPDLVARLALPYFCAVPTNTPADPRAVRTVPSAGPYYVTSYRPAQTIVLRANPNYRGSRPHRTKKIAVTLSVSPAQSLAHVIAGRADYAMEGVPREADARLAARFGHGSRAAAAGRQQYFVDPRLQVDFLVLNARRPLFASLRMRQAVNYAVDRGALAPTDAFDLGRPTSQYLPPGMPGFRPGPVYPLAPAPARARRLARGGPRIAVLYTCDVLTCRELAQIVKENLRSIGLAVDVHELSVSELLDRIVRANEPFDLAVFGYGGDVADPGSFLEGMVALPVLDLHRYAGRIEAADRLTGAARYRVYGRLADDLARGGAPVVAFSNPVRQDFFSRRVGCQVYNPLYGMDLGSLCLRR